MERNAKGTVKGTKTNIIIVVINCEIKISGHFETLSAVATAARGYS
jgi:hypothetical protein